MSPAHFGQAAFISLAYVVWPILGKWSGAGGAWTSNLVIAFSLITSLAFTGRQMLTQEAPSWTAVGILSVAGLINGAAVLLYSIRSAEPGASTTVFMVTVMVLMVVFTPIVNYIINKEGITLTQGVAVLLIVVGVVMLSVKDLSVVGSMFK